ncbi:MAG: HPr family phosphocarrier protein, partial [Natronospirillum sp.]
ARASAKLNALAKQFTCSILVEKDGQQADAKSIMSLMMLAASKGTHVFIEVSGDDEEIALAALKSLINNRFDEGE